MTASRFFAFADTEYSFVQNGVTTFFDVFAQQDHVSLGFEVETTLRHATDNARKAMLVNVPL